MVAGQRGRGKNEHFNNHSGQLHNDYLLTHTGVPVYTIFSCLMGFVNLIFEYFSSDVCT